MVQAGDTRPCPKCRRWVPLLAKGFIGKLMWPPHKPGRGKQDDCPTSGDEYKGV